MAAHSGVVLLFARPGGMFGIQLATSGPMFDIIKGLPSYWWCKPAKTALGGGWPAEAWIVVVVWTIALIPSAALAYPALGHQALRVRSARRRTPAVGQARTLRTDCCL
jgi:hypothetical protein